MNSYDFAIQMSCDGEKFFRTQREAMACGHWPFYRYNPELRTEGKNPLIIGNKEASIPGNFSSMSP